MLREKLNRLPADWNIRVFTEQDFFDHCTAGGIRVIEADFQLEGAYCVYDQQPLIFLRRSLPYPRRLFVAFHELAHHWLHYPGMQLFHNTHCKVEQEAHLVAACALIPCPVLESRPLWEIGEEYGYSGEMLRFRAEVWERWKL